ncbi:hypothetical protein KOAAANKH_02980 [Brevundimonas sp. NIBR10]|uniref:hypothetical protein n=1 Tax=Brevundimonas sp. NIBR10 TaxID=3015997 RepID=UPI0022F17CC8|nr:hypothetical protein [Brevundimonas sp. NIBR10]WGM48091.1 hypothetical protein KOAAANKH_02980 [Brevundimonas sp. NIBR10]
MIDSILADHALELLSCTIADIIEEAYPITVEAVIGGDRSREDLLAEAGEDVLTLVRAMRVYRRRVVSTQPADRAADGE